ncbi:hypothetical protein TNCV_3638851 [Trichonephila clavipes]|nr:hypothetical protein TNCV_3638851 [Trichonephila clavipes]
METSTILFKNGSWNSDQGQQDNQLTHQSDIQICCDKEVAPQTITLGAGPVYLCQRQVDSNHSPGLLLLNTNWIQPP